MPTPFPSDSFVSLHTHTEYSMLDGAAKIGELVQAAVDDGQPAMAITDHGNLYGALDFYQTATDAGITPLLGMEAYFSPCGIDTRPSKADGEKAYHHLSILAVNNTGWRNLVKLSSRAFLEGYWRKPRLDFEMLAEHHDGLVVLSGCLGGTVCQHLLHGDHDAARATAGRFVEILGPENFYVEVMRHDILEQDRVLPGLVDLARHLGVGLVATNDCHYTHRHDATAHDALLCVQTGARLAETNRFRFENENFYLRPAREMRHLFRDLPEACDNTLVIAERGEIALSFEDALLPQFPVPEGHDAPSYLRELVLTGARARYGAELSGDVAERIEYELGVIHDMGFDAYFLIVWDLLRHAREVGIRVGPGRGSAAGAVVAYCLGIVQIDPLAYDLLFERFLNPGRKQMPDIDMDFDTRGREEIIRYAAQKYGSDHVAQIITFGRIKARAAVRDAARVLDKPYALGDKISKAMPPLLMGRDTPLAACFTKTPGHEEGYKMAAELRGLYDADAEVREIVDLAKGLEGLVRQDGIHAGAVVIAPQPLTEYLPIQRKPDAGGDPTQAPIVTQFDMGWVEKLGLLKMDVLGLRNLDVIDRAVELIAARTGETIDIDRIPLDDPATFSLLARGDTVGVFQLEGAAMRKLLRQLAPTEFDDIAAVVALYRPGPMGQNWHLEYAERKNGRKEVTYPDPDLEPVLGSTYGLCIFQEQIMRTAQVLAGYSMADADDLRKAMAKKKPAHVALHRTKFIDGCLERGYSQRFAESMFDMIEPWSGYGFNRSHAVAYGFVSYQTAYLKANYPAEYLAALIASVADKQEKAQVYLAEAAAMGIAVLTPDINVAGVEARVDDQGRIVFGLGGVRGVGADTAAAIVAARSEGGPFGSLDDVCRRVGGHALNRRVLENLTVAGAFDGFGPRQGTLGVLAGVLEGATRARKDKDAGLVSLFGDDDPELSRVSAIPALEFDRAERMRREREVLGVYLSDHPLRGREHAVAAVAKHRIADLEDLEGTIVVAGVVTKFATRPTRSGSTIGSFVLDGVDGTAEVAVFAKTIERSRAALVDGGVVVVECRKDDRDPDKLVAFTVTAVDLDTVALTPAADTSVPASITTQETIMSSTTSSPTSASDPYAEATHSTPAGDMSWWERDDIVHLRIEESAVTPERLAVLRALVDTHPGDHDVFLSVCRADDVQVVTLGEAFRVAPSAELSRALDALDWLDVAL